MTKYNTKSEKLQEKDLPKSVTWKHVKMVKAGNIIDVTKLSFKPTCNIKKVSKSQYITGYYDYNGDFNSDGEVLEMREKHSQMRNRRSLRKIFTDLRQLISANFWDKSGYQLFLTLTYAEQTNDHKQIHKDFKNFWDRLKRKWGNNIEYISIVEPHGTGMFHIHVLITTSVMIMDDNFPPWGDDMIKIGRELYDVWGHGFVTAEQLNDVDNIGAYFIAYFSNLEIADEDVEKYDDDIIEKNGKKYIKGKRLDFYPDYMQIYRYSRGLVKPVKGEFDIQNCKRTYQSITKLTTDDYEMYVQNEQYKEEE